MAFLSALTIPQLHYGPQTRAQTTRRPRIVPLCAKGNQATPPRPRKAKTASSKAGLDSKTAAKTEKTSKGAEDYLLSLDISIEHVRRILSRLPRLAAESDVPKLAAPMHAFLKDGLRMNRRQIARTIRFAPHILYRDAGTFTANLEFLDTVARIAASDRANAIAKCPHVLWMDVQSASGVVQKVVDACPLITPMTLGTVFTRVPQALITSCKQVETNIERIREAGVCEPASMARVIAKAPLALVYSADNTLDKRLNYLSTELQLPLRTMGKVLIAVPQILDWSVDKVIRPKIRLLAGVVGADGVVNVVDKVPMVLGMDDMLDRVLWMREQVGLSDSEIAGVVREAPAVLTYSVVGNLAPKWAFICDTMGGTKEDVVKVPRESLCANLQQRAMPRYAFLASRGRHDVAVVDVLKGSDVDFCKLVAQCNAAEFREYVDNDTYLLFFSQLL